MALTRRLSSFFPSNINSNPSNTSGGCLCRNRRSPTKNWKLTTKKEKKKMTLGSKLKYFQRYEIQMFRLNTKQGVLKNFAKFTGKHLCQSIFLNKVAGLRPVTLIKKCLWHRCFPVNFAKFLRTYFLQNTSGRLLLSREF